MTKTEKLLASIKKYNEAYRSGDALIPDSEYDKLIEELKQADPNNEWFNAIEPVKVSKKRKIKLPIPMKSLNKVKNPQALQNWASSIGLTLSSEIILTPKFDGLSLLHDEDNNKAYSRGGAENEGQDCSAHYLAASNIINVVSPFKFTFGEFVFSKKSWNQNFFGKTAPDTGDKYKSPRNTAAGLLNRDEPSDNLQYIDFFRYGVDDSSLTHFSTYEELFHCLCSTFKQPILYKKIIVKELTTELCQKAYQDWSKQYYIDGLVIYANNLAVWHAAGRQETTGNPNYAIAYKDPNFTETFETTVKDITWRVNKAGALKPVINIDTIDTGDCNMENPTGYNAGWVRDHHIAKGARVLVTRSGGIIPTILETIQNASSEENDKLWERLCYCPHCGASTIWDNKKIELKCTNPNCRGIKLAKIIFFFKTLNAENLGEETLTKIFNEGYAELREILDITFNDLLYIEGFGETTANQILNAISKIRKGVNVIQLMHASDCFNGIGQVKAKAIMSQLQPRQRQAICDGQLYDWDSNEDLKTKGYFINANATLKSFMLGLIPFYDFIAKNHLTILPFEKQSKTGDLCSGLKVCFTGIRDTALEHAITSNGGEIASSVSKKTTHLVVDDMDSQSSKAKKARQIGIPIMTITVFKKTYNL